MKHLNSASELARLRRLVCRVLSLLLFVNLLVSTHAGAATAAKESYFIDPTAVVECGTSLKFCSFGSSVYIGPFATILAGPTPRNKTASITIGNNSDVQDNTLLDATRQAITIGDSVIIAHGAAVYGGAKIGVTGHCPEGVPVCASFVGFNSEVAEGATVERDAMVMHLAKVGPGVTIPSEHVVLPGKSVMSNAEVPDKTIEIVDGDRSFMAAVIRVNIALAAGYNGLEAHDRTSVCGMNVNPATDFAPHSTSPSFAGGPPRTDPLLADRLIGDIRFTQGELPRMGSDVSLRADEGTPFEVGTIASLNNFTTFHALEHTALKLGDNGTYGVGSLVHGGSFGGNVTSTKEGFVLGDDSVFFNATADIGCHIGRMSFVSTVNLPARMEIPLKTVVLGEQRSRVEWDRRPRKIVKSRSNRCRA